MKKCHECGAEAYRDESKYCTKCGKELPESEAEQLEHINICRDEDCEYHKTRFIYPDDARFCDACGSPTMFNR